MAEETDDNLDNLRQRATCPICYNIFTEPKRMPNCSHVLCLGCLTRYLRSKLPNNFPTCPICRKPITVSLREIRKFEPARAEADIVALINNFETCGFCKKKKHPKNKCVDCGKFICDKCKLCHAELRKNHTLEAIILTSESSQPTSELCKRHKDQTLDFFCIMCQTLMCQYCEKYSHAKCKDKYHNEHVLQQYNTGLLQAFVQGSGERRYLHKSGSLERIVYIKEFAAESRKWLNIIKADLEDAVDFYDGYKRHLNGIVDEQLSTELEMDIRRQKIWDEVDIMLDCAKNLQSKCTDLLEASSDTEVARVILDMEQLCSCFFMIRTDYYLFVRPLKLTLEHFGHFRMILKTVSSCKLLESTNSFACMLRMKPTEIETPNSRSTITFEDKAAVKVHSIRSALPKRIQNKNDAVYNRAVFVDRGSLKNCHCFFHKYGRYWEFQMALNFSNGCTYAESPVSQLRENALRELSNHDIQTASCQYFGRRAPSCHPCSFYIETANDDNPRICFRVGGEHDERYGNLESSLFYTSAFTNVYGPILNLPIQTVRQANHVTSTIYLTAIIGKSAPFGGLETLFIYFEDDIFKIHAICVSSSIAKLNIADALDPKQIQSINCHLITDELGIFSLCNATNNNEESVYTSFRSRLTTSDNHENFISPINFNGQYTHPIPLRCLNVDLLCYVKKGLYFVKRELEYNKLIIGKLTESPITGFIEEEPIRSVKQTEINVPIRSLKPLTLVENRNEEVVVVCSVEHLHDQMAALFVMIYPNRDGSDAVVLLQVENRESGTDIGHGTVLDAEMDPDGNIMFVLEHKNGKNFCVFTKHFMP